MVTQKLVFQLVCFDGQLQLHTLHTSAPVQLHKPGSKLRQLRNEQHVLFCGFCAMNPSVAMTLT
jgi:hypothetical protein